MSCAENVFDMNRGKLESRGMCDEIFSAKKFCFREKIPLNLNRLTRGESLYIC